MFKSSGLWARMRSAKVMESFALALLLEGCRYLLMGGQDRQEGWGEVGGRKGGAGAEGKVGATEIKFAGWRG